MTPRDAARSRHPSSGGPSASPQPGAVGRLPTILAAALLSGLVALLAPLLPLAVLICAAWVLVSFTVTACWCALCEVARARRFDRHTAQALRVVE